MYLGTKIKAEIPGMVKEQILRSFVGSRGGFSKELLAAGGIFVSTSLKAKNMVKW